MAICGEVDHSGDSVRGSLGKLKQLLLAYNAHHEENQITETVVVMPFHVSDIHWNLGHLQLKATLEVIAVDIIEPLHSQIYQNSQLQFFTSVFEAFEVDQENILI